MSRMIPISVKLPAELLNRADIAASRLNVSRAEIIRIALKHFIEDIEKRDRARLNSKIQGHESVNGAMREKWIYIEI